VLLATDEGYWVLRQDGERVFIDEYYDRGEHAVVAFSTDGRRAAGIEPEGAWVYDVLEHAMREILDMEDLDEPTDVAWSPSDDWLLITSEDGLTICGMQDGEWARIGIIDDSPGFEAAAFGDETTIAAKRGDALLLFATGVTN
jgi:hypothetical protein